MKGLPPEAAGVRLHWGIGGIPENKGGHRIASRSKPTHCLSVEKAELAPCPAHSPHTDLRLLSRRRSRSGCSSNRDHVAWKVQIIYSLALKRRSLLTPDVEHPGEGREAEYLFTLLVLGCPGVISSPALPSCP